MIEAFKRKETPYRLVPERGGFSMNGVSMTTIKSRIDDLPYNLKADIDITVYREVPQGYESCEEWIERITDDVIFHATKEQLVRFGRITANLPLKGPDLTDLLDLLQEISKNA